MWTIGPCLVEEMLAGHWNIHGRVHAAFGDLFPFGSAQYQWKLTEGLHCIFQYSLFLFILCRTRSSLVNISLSVFWLMEGWGLKFWARGGIAALESKEMSLLVNWAAAWWRGSLLSNNQLMERDSFVQVFSVCLNSLCSVHTFYIDSTMYNVRSMCTLCIVRTLYIVAPGFS